MELQAKSISGSNEKFIMNWKQSWSSTENDFVIFAVQGT